MARVEGDAGVYAALAKVMVRIPAIGKDANNVRSGYAARSIDAVMEALHPLLADEGLVVLPEVLSAEYDTYTNQKGTLLTNARLRVAYHFTAYDGSQATMVVAGEARDAADKATNKAMSAALKYGLLQCFLVPLEGIDDADLDTIEATAELPRTADPVVWAKRQVFELVGGKVGEAEALWGMALGKAGIQVGQGEAIPSIDATLAAKVVAEAQRMMGKEPAQ